jgi:hypothetical protein
VLPLLPGLTGQPGERRPLPDAGAVRRLVIPDSAPPYDDELRPGPSSPGRAGRSSVSGARPARAAQPGQDPAPRGAGPAPASPRPGNPSPRPAGPRPLSSRGQAGSRSAADGGWPGQFAQALAETLAGSRPSQQIVPWTTVQARRRIRQLGPQLSATQRPLVRRIVTSHPADDVVEMTVVVRFGTRTRALAVRLERDGPRLRSPGRQASPGRWLCTAIEAA